ncbi:MAG TPA: hypothetical protein PKC76_09130 [Saprospiraceae bacterium]|nr:hypothetical protein [Saprospiraceae bacterium]HMP24282.1 hypothetical protein [Saprospiraceae bacterium]
MLTIIALFFAFNAFTLTNADYDVHTVFTDDANTTIIARSVVDDDLGM